MEQDAGRTRAIALVAFFLGTLGAGVLWFFGGFACGVFGMCSSAPEWLIGPYSSLVWATPLVGAAFAWWAVRRYRHRARRAAGTRTDRR